MIVQLISVLILYHATTVFAAPQKRQITNYVVQPRPNTIFGQPLQQQQQQPVGNIDTSRPPVLDLQKGYYTAQIGQGVYWLTDGMYDTMFIVTNQGVVAVDAPPTIGQKYLNAIREVTNQPVTHVIYTHSHRDHIGSGDIFPSNVMRIAHKETWKNLAERRDPKRPVPTYLCDAQCMINVGGKQIQMEYRGPAHMTGNIYIYLPQDQILMIVDIIFPGWVPFKNLAMAEDHKAYLDAHDVILQNYPQFRYLIGGHVNRLGTRQDVELQKQYFNDVTTNARQALQEVQPDFQAGNPQTWVKYAKYMDDAARRCYEKTLPRWSSQLQGADVYTLDHCFILTEALRIDIS